MKNAIRIKLLFAFILVVLSTALFAQAKDNEVRETERKCVEILTESSNVQVAFVNQVWQQFVEARNADKEMSETLVAYYNDKVVFTEGDDQGENTFPVEFDSDAGILRRKLVAMMNVPMARKALVAAAKAVLWARSERVAARLKAGSLEYDVVIRGGGVHDVVALNGFAGSGQMKRMKILTIESEAVYASTFETRRFFMNSSLGPTQYGRRQRPGEKENLNYIPGGIIQLPLFVSARYPFSTDLADMLTILRALSPADILFNTKAEISSYEAAETKRRFKFKAGEGTVYSKVALNVTGLGDENFSETLKIKDKAKPAVDAGRIQRANQFLERSRKSQTPYREFVGKTISIIGGGNSADNSVEWLIRALEDLDYGRDNTGVGFPEKIIWHNPRFPEGLTDKNCNQYVQMTRVRYCAIAAAIKSGLVEIVRGRVAKISYSNDREKVKIVDPKFEYYVDYAVVAIGYTDRSSDSIKFGKIVDEKDEFTLDDQTYVMTSVSSRDGVIGKVLQDSRENTVPLFWAGTSAKIELSDEEKAGVSQNSVAIFLLAPKTYLLAGEIANEYFAED